MESTLSKKKIERLEIRLNPSNPLDALLLAKMETVSISAPALVKTLLVNYFAGQPGGIGLDAAEQSSFADMQPRSAKKQVPVRSSVVEKVPARLVVKPDQNVSAGGWGPKNLPPCFDTSELELS